MSQSITRRTFAACLAGSVSLAPDYSLAAPPPTSGVGMGYMLWNFTLDYLDRLDERRRARWESVQSAGQARELQQKVREGVLRMWGGFPAEKSPLNPRQLGTLERGDYWIEKIVFESRPRFYVTANLYRPSVIQGRHPAILFTCGHAAEGKAAEAYQRFCIHMARRGFVVFAWDPVGQGERIQLWDKEKKEGRAGSGTREHRVLGDQCYLLGSNLMQYRAWDTLRALDYLLLRPEVDPAKIGLAGNSGGGMEALQFAGLEPRLAATFTSCAVATFPAKTAAMLMADPEQVLEGTLRDGIDHQELLAAFGPRPLLVGSATDDYVPIDAARETVGEVKRIYGLFDAEENLSHAETKSNHGLDETLRLAGAKFFSEKLGGKKAPDIDESILVATAKELRCTSDGQVVASLGGETVWSLNQRLRDEQFIQREAPRAPGAFAVYRNEIQQAARELTAVGSYRPEAGVFCPERMFDVGAFAKGVAVVVAEQGKDDVAVRRTVIDPILSAGYRVIAIDVRGWGETTPYLPEANGGFLWDNFFAYRGLEMGRPLLGQRIKDYLANAPKNIRQREWIAVGVGAGALVAAHAAVLEPRIEGLITVGGPLSFRRLIDDPLTRQPFSNVLPGVISRYDVRDLYAAIAPRRALVLNPEDTQRKPVEIVEAREELDWVNQVFEGQHAPRGFQVHSRIDAQQARDAIIEWLQDS